MKRLFSLNFLLIFFQIPDEIAQIMHKIIVACYYWRFWSLFYRLVYKSWYFSALPVFFSIEGFQLKDFKYPNIAAEKRRLWEQTSKQPIFVRLAGALLYSAVSNIIRNTASQIRFFKTQK